jgi:DNA-binding response OmpR family regulator
MDPLDAPEEPSVELVVCAGGPAWHTHVSAAVASPSYAIQLVGSGGKALELIESLPQPPSAVIMDVEVGEMSGLALCRAIRESTRHPEVPILMVSRLAGEMDRILAFENGVDDFLADPFYQRELASRLRAVMRRHSRRSPAAATASATSFGPLRIDFERTRVEVDGQRVDLTAREFGLLRAMVENEGRVLERSELAGDAEGTITNPRVVDTHVKSIRRKLGHVRHCIETVRGVGYRFSGDMLRRLA